MAKINTLKSFDQFYPNNPLTYKNFILIIIEPEVTY
jgi:hypothetical protein